MSYLSTVIMPTYDHTHSWTSETSACPSSVSNVQLKLPPFWHNDPTIWFAQVHAKFMTRGITQQKTKFVYVVASLQPEYAQEIWDFNLSSSWNSLALNWKPNWYRGTPPLSKKRLHWLLINEEFEGSQTLPVTSQDIQKLQGRTSWRRTFGNNYFSRGCPTKLCSAHFSINWGLNGDRENRWFSRLNRRDKFYI